MSIGAEKRSGILPTEEPKGIGFLGPDYNYDDELIRPAQMGIKRDDTLASVFQAVRGVAYYMDSIAFGEASNPLTAGLPFKHLGTNYFIKTGAKCSNGADMWHYMELIPKGDAFGKNVGLAAREMGMTSLRGMAPGAVEDVKGAINVGPALKSIFGTGYPVCKLMRLPVGDESRKIFNYENGNPWIDDMGSVRLCEKDGYGNWQDSGPYFGPTRYGEGKYRACQTKWVLDRMVSKKEWDADKKVFNPDGTPATQKYKAEPFTDGNFECMPNKWLLIALLGLTAANFWAYSRR